MNLKKLPIAGVCIVLLATVVILPGCSTKKNTFTRRVYHNLTSHFNVYWNGMDQLRNGVKEYQKTIKDNYALILPVYNYGDKANTGTINQYADISIAKASKTVQKHSMEFNKKEYVKWIDDSYLLIGKAYYFKQDFGMARRTFEFVSKTYNTNDIKYEAILWMAMSNIQMKDFKRAEPLLDMLQNKLTQGEAPKKLETPLHLAYAQFFILQEKYDAAIPYLENAVDQNPGKELKTRCLFILGQIHQRNEDYPIASELYKRVIQRSPSFEMEFNAQINLAQCYDTQSGDKNFIIKKLNRMLKDDKNKEHLDQIYYALAQISLKDKDTTQGINYLTLSVSSSKGNNYQKAISALGLADIYFNIPDYKLAQAYYDSTMQFLPPTYPNYKGLKRKTETLTDLVANLQVIQKEDSLQKLASMTEEDRNRLIDEMIVQLIQAEQQRKLEELERKENPNLFESPDRQMSSVAGPREGKWYFYNTAALSNGFSAFTAKWGRRKLEDLWFLSNKNVISFEDEYIEGDSTMLPGDSSSRATLANITNPKKRDFYLKDIPLTPEQVDSSNERIINAYYNAGFIYVDGLKDLKSAIESFETLLSRFPGNRREAPSCFELYILYGELDNQPQRDHYKDIVLTEYPETDYAKLLINPDYYKEIQEQGKQAQRLYEETWNAFNNQQFYMVLHNAEKAATEYPGDTSLLPRFEYLRALALGKVEVVDSLVLALQEIIRKYPTHQVKPLAMNILEYLSQQRNSQGEPLVEKTTKEGDPADILYTYNPNAIHFYILIVNAAKMDVNALKVKLADFNTKYFSLNNLNINSLVLDNSREMVTINNFDDAASALLYFNTIKESEYIFNKLQNVGDYAGFIISVENYPVFYKNKDTNIYMRFFEKNYHSDNPD